MKLSLLLFLFLVPLSLQALVIGDPNETIINNTSPAANFPWANTGSGNTFSSVYIGNGWVLGSQHTGMPSNFTSSAGGTYTTVAGTFTQIGGADLAVYQLSSIPAIPDVTFYCEPLTVGTDVIMTGHGRVRADYDDNGTLIVADDFYPWSNNGAPRWGTNTISPVTVNDSMGNPIPEAVATEFNTHTSGAYTSSEAQAATGDSGGGVWVNNGGNYELAGIMFGISDISDARAEYGDFTTIVQLANFKNEIYSVTGIPEPSSAVLGALAGILCLLKRKRR